MNEEQRQAITQVATVLTYIDEEQIKKVPEEVLMFIDKNRSNNYYYDIDLSKPFEELDLKEYALVFLAWLSINYFCDSEEEKKEIKNILKDNQQEHDLKIQTKFAPNGVLGEGEIFKKDTDFSEGPEQKALAVYDKKSFVSKIFNKIKKFFKRA